VTLSLSPKSVIIFNIKRKSFIRCNNCYYTQWSYHAQWKVLVFKIITKANK